MLRATRQRLIEEVRSHFHRDLDYFIEQMQIGRTPYPNPMLLFYTEREKGIYLMLEEITLLDAIRNNFIGTIWKQITVQVVGMGYWFHIEKHPPHIDGQYRFYATHLICLLYTRYARGVANHRLYEVTYSDPLRDEEVNAKDWVDPHFTMINRTETGAQVHILNDYLVNPFFKRLKNNKSEMRI